RPLGGRRPEPPAVCSGRDRRAFGRVGPMIRVFSRGIRRIPHLERFLGEPVTWGSAAPEAERAVAGWGLRPSARRAIDYAERKGLPYLALEDGFLRSVFPGP